MDNNSSSKSYSSRDEMQAYSSPKGSPNGGKISDPGEWLIWCQENKVLKQNVDLVHYEFETCRRHFNTLKFDPNDEGVHPKTLADSFFRAELFPTFNEALQYCNKLRNDENLITYSDLLEATQCKFSYKRNKARSYVKFVASSDIFLKALHAHEAEALANPSRSSKTIVNSTSTVDVSYTDGGAGKFERHSTRRLDSVNESQYSSTQQTNHVVDIPLSQDEEQPLPKLEQPQKQQQRQPPNRLDSLTIISGTIENGRKALARLYSNASEMLHGMFEKSEPSITNTDNHPHSRSHPRRQDSRESGGILKFFSRSLSRAPSYGEHDHAAHQHPRPIMESEPLTEEQTPSPIEQQNSNKLVLKRNESGEAITIQVRPKRASMKVYTHGQVLHTFPARNSRISAEETYG